MPKNASDRTQTSAAERTNQNRRLQEEVAIATGDADITIRKAAAYRREQRAQARGPIPARDIDFGDDDVAPIGIVLASVDEYRVLKGGSAALRLITDSREFGDVLHDAARISASEIVIAALYHIPRDYGLDAGNPDDDMDVTDDDPDPED